MVEWFRNRWPEEAGTAMSRFVLSERAGYDSLYEDTDEIIPQKIVRVIQSVARGLATAGTVSYLTGSLS